MKRLLLPLLLTLAFGGYIFHDSATAQPLATPPTTGLAPAPPSACADGAVLDDGTRELGYGWIPSVREGQFVQEFPADLFPGPALETVCVCWLRNGLSGDDDDIDFEVVFYQAVNNPDPEEVDCPILPGEEPYAMVPATATGVPLLGDGQFYEVDVSGVIIPPGIGYIGVRWDASASRFFFLCADQSESTPPVDGFFRDEKSEGWASVFKTRDPIFDDYRSLMIRVKSSGSLTATIPTLGPPGLLLLAALVGLFGWRKIQRL